MNTLLNNLIPISLNSCISNLNEIHYEKAFPHRILYWEESCNDSGRMLTTKGTLIKTMKSAYWNKNRAQDAKLRKELGLEH